MMPDAPWTWDDKSKRYRDNSTGRYLSHSKMLSLRDQFTSAMVREMDLLVESLANGDITVQRWVTAARDVLRTIYLDQYALGRGGRHVMTQEDYGRIGGLLRSQYAYLNRFANVVAEGTLSVAQIRQRLRMYANSGTQAYERGYAAAMGVIALLPAYPGDGQTVCKTNCKCSWVYERHEDRVDCTWSLGVAEHCPDCVENSKKWAPFTVHIRR
jgi:hypothetical protein